MATKYARANDALYAHYKMNDSLADTVVLDSSGNGRDATSSVNTSVLATTGKVGGGFLFPHDTGSYVTTPFSPADLPVAAKDLSINVWVNCTLGIATNDCIWSADYNGNNAFQVRISASNPYRLILDHETGEGGFCTGTLSYGTWYMLTIVVSGSTTSSYVNGNLYTTFDSAGWSLSTQDFKLGRRYDVDDPFYGSLDMFSAYNRALTTDEIEALYNEGAGTESIPIDWTTAGSWSTSSGGASDTTIPEAGDDVVLDSNSGDIDIDDTAECGTVTCTGYTNTLTQEADITTTGAVTLVAGMTFTYTSGVWYMGADTITSAGKTFGSVNLNDTGTYILADAMDISTLLDISTGVTATLSTSDITLSGSLTVTGSGIIIGRTITMNGTGTWDHTSNGTVKSNLIFDTAGTITISGYVYFSTGTLTYTAGTMVVSGSTIGVGGANTSIDISGMTPNNLSIIGTTSYTLTLLSALNLETELGFYMTDSGTVTMAGAFDITCLTFRSAPSPGKTTTLSLSGDIYAGSLRTASTISSNVNGRTIYVTSAISGDSVSYYWKGTTKCVICNPSGTFVWANPIGLDVDINSGGTVQCGTSFSSGNAIVIGKNLTYIAGTFSRFGSQYFGVRGTCTITSAGCSFPAFWFGDTATTSVTLADDFTVTDNLKITRATTVSGAFDLTCGSLTTAGAYTHTISGNDWICLGDLTVTADSTIDGAGKQLGIGGLVLTGATLTSTADIVFTGTGTWSASSAEFMHSGDLIINTAGTITLGDNAGMQSGTLTGIAGTIAGGTFHIEDSCILDVSAITFPDVTVGSLAAADITLSDDFNCTILRVDNNTTFDTSGGAYNVNCTSMIGVDGFYGYNPFTLYTDKEFLAYSDLTSSYLNISNPHPKPGSDTLDTLASFQLLLRSPSGVDVDEEGHIWILSEDRNTLYALDAMYDYFLTDKENRWVYFRENYSDPGVFIKPA